MLFKKNISPSCEYCCYSKKIANDLMGCVKYGITNKENCCKKFKYNPLKRIPKKPKPILNFNKKDFIL